jgi:hypothetical protein
MRPDYPLATSTYVGEEEELNVSPSWLMTFEGQCKPTGNKEGGTEGTRHMHF